MTCIVGLECDGAVYLGGDSALSDQATGALRILKDPKVFENVRGPYNVVIGVCGELRVTQLLQRSLNLPDWPADADDDQYVVVNFVNAVRSLQKKRGALKNSDGVETQDAELLVGLRGRLYTVEDNFQAYRVVEPYAAVGSGSDVALGSLYSTSKLGNLSPEERITLALEAAEAYNTLTRRPFHIVKLEPEKE